MYLSDLSEVLKIIAHMLHEVEPPFFLFECFLHLTFLQLLKDLCF